MWKFIGVLGVVACSGLPAFADARGWQYLMAKLVADGVDQGRVEAVFNDARLEPFGGLEFSAERPRESRALYRRFLRPAGVTAARQCRRRYAGAFEAAERTDGVSADVLAAILSIESGCGRNTGSYVAFYRLARLAMANEPANVQHNIARIAEWNGTVDPEVQARLRERARSLEQTFYPEVRAMFVVAPRLGIEPLDLRGSGAGAFGAPQFLPTSYLAYGVDADGDGRVSLDDPGDAAASCARYFAAHGWHPGLSYAERRATVWQYNRSTAYVDTVLSLAARIAQPVTPHHAPVHHPKRHKVRMAARKL